MKQKAPPSFSYTTDPREFKNFVVRLQSCKKLHKPLANTLANIFSMRYIGNKTHGDLAEVGITEFINLFMYDYECIHVGKEFFRSKDHEEDIAIRSKFNNTEQYIPISLKAYGKGPLQLSTDKGSQLYDFLKKMKISDTKAPDLLQKVLDKIDEVVMFNVIPLIYVEKEVKNYESNARHYNSKCNILLFNTEKMKQNLGRIVFVDTNCVYDYDSHSVTEKKAGKRKHPIFLFLSKANEYICEVRYGDKSANALQRGLWSNTAKAETYFQAMFENWIPYEKREKLLELLQKALNSEPEGHENAIKCLNENLKRIKKNIG